jgi:hypothetical protein
MTDASSILKQNIPNPFSESTVIRWQVPVESRQSAVGSQIVIKVYDFMGKEVRTLADAGIAPGEHQVTFDAKGLPAGVYFYQLHAGSSVRTKKMVLIR